MNKSVCPAIFAGRQNSFYTVIDIKIANIYINSDV